MNRQTDKQFFKDLYHGFEMPLSELDCGLKCGPYNDYGVPVCCDINLVVPAAFEQEWAYLRHNTDLWQPWSSSQLADLSLQEEVQEGQVLLECQGYQRCQRPFRTLTCRAFPFYPYLTSAGDFRGLAYYRDFREECWIISNLSVVSLEYKAAFRVAFEKVFEAFPSSRQDFLDFCQYAREQAAADGETLTVLDFQGGAELVDPETEAVIPVGCQELEAYGPFAVARELRFPDEAADWGDAE